MIYQHTWEKVLSGEKTNTRRIEHLGDMFTFPISMVVIGKDHGKILDSLPALPEYSAHHQIYRVVNNGITRYQVGKTYAVQPGRGKKSVGRIEITNIRREDVRCISDEDVQAEGFQTTGDFWHTWVSMHDKSWYETFCYANDCDYLREYGFYERPEKRYQAWVLTIKLVEG